jgi:hypothetical protein
MLLDRSKLPPDLVVLRVWAPENEQDTRRPIAHLGDRRRRLIVAVLLTVAALAGGAALVVMASWLAFTSLLIVWAAVAYADRGHGGFYEIKDDGSLGHFLGRSPPDLSSMKSRKPC